MAKQVRRKKTILVALVMLAAVPAMALDKEDVSVEKEDRSYLIRAVFDVPAGVDQVKSVLTDFTHPSRLTSAVTARKVLRQQDGAVRKAPALLSEHAPKKQIGPELLLKRDHVIGAAAVVTEYERYRSLGPDDHIRAVRLY